MAIYGQSKKNTIIGKKTYRQRKTVDEKETEKKKLCAGEKNVRVKAFPWRLFTAYDNSQPSREKKETIRSVSSSVEQHLNAKREGQRKRRGLYASKEGFISFLRD